MGIKLAGVSSNHIPWKEQIDLLEVEALSDEYAWDDLLEMVEDGKAGVGVPSIRRIPTPVGNFSRHTDTARKTATVSNWDNEFSNAQAHAQGIMAKIGNGR